MTRQDLITRILTEHFSPSYLEVRDVSHTHAGHAGARPEGQTHYEVVIRSVQFLGMNKVKSHQAIYALLAEEFKTGLHALAIDASAMVD
ncbi:MAG: BolA family transcriptional regulator [Alphaproteobacteria bacterium]|nr:BolA family transcriptional regulator [Alphaproteobacteria bacterium]